MCARCLLYSVQNQAVHEHDKIVTLNGMGNVRNSLSCVSINYYTYCVYVKLNKIKFSRLSVGTQSNFTHNM